MADHSKNNEYSQKTFRLNLGVLFFAFIFIYLIVYLVTGLKSNNITGYQVKTGMLQENRIYTGIALRDENTVTSDYSGYVSFFISEGERTSYNNLVYCIDETGKLSDLTGADPSEDNSLSNEELTSLRQDIELFAKNFDESVFSETDTFASRMENKIVQIENRKIIENLDSIGSSHSNDIIEYIRAKKPGIVLFYQDGYEDALPSDITESDFDSSAYESKVVYNDDLITTGDFVYKYVFDENWSIVIKVLPDELERLESLDYVEVRFSKTRDTSWARVNIINRGDDYSLVELKFTNSMITFCKDRYVEIELLIEDENGLKIPNSAICEKSFYLIDKDFVTTGDNSNSLGVLRREFGEAGETVPKFVEIEIYKETDDEYYVDTSSLNYGDTLIKPDTALSTANESESLFVVGKQGTLEGVYCINQGYPDFKRIVPDSSNDEYTIVKPNEAYGLNAYDYIALDASSVTDSDYDN